MKVMFALWMSAFALVAGSSTAIADYAADQQRFKRWIDGGLLDPDAPIEQRKAIVGELEAIAKDDSDPEVLYILGSLYRQDPAHSSSPLDRDLDRARELLSRAALQGRILAMAKLSTIELSAGNRFEANVWAQLFGHYEINEAKRDLPPNAIFMASILRKALEGFPKQDLERLNQAVDDMISHYDTQIRSGMKVLAGLRDGVGSSNPKLGNGTLASGKVNGRRPETGMVEYVLQLKSDGKVADFWVLDAWPDPRIVQLLNKLVRGYSEQPQSAEKGSGKIQRLRFYFDDGRFKIRERVGKD